MGGSVTHISHTISILLKLGQLVRTDDGHLVLGWSLLCCLVVFEG